MISSITRRCQRFPMTPKPALGAKEEINFGTAIKTRSVVDIQPGLINKVSVTPPNVTDAQGFEHVAPEPRGLSHADKGYCTDPARTTAAQKGRSSGGGQEEQYEGEKWGP